MPRPPLPGRSAPLCGVGWLSPHPALRRETLFVAAPQQEAASMRIKKRRSGGRTRSLATRLLGRLVDVPSKEWKINKPGKVYR